MSATLDDVMRVMLSQEQKQDDTTSAINDLGRVFKKQFLKDERGAPDRMEAEREAKKAGSGEFDLSKIMAFPGLDDLTSGVNSLVMMAGNLAKMVAGLTAAVAGVLLAFEGIRGWELDAIKNIKSVGTRLRGLFPGAIATRIGDAMDLLRVSVARFFGIDPMNGKLLANGSRVGPKGFIPKVAYPKGFTQIIGEAFDLFRSSILTKFGIDPATGKMLKLTGDAAEDASPIARVIGRVGIQLNSLFRPIRSFTSAIGGFFKGDIFKGISKFVGAGGRLILAVFKKVFYPIGLVFAAFDGIKAYMESDAQTVIGKLGEGIGGFVGDFIGAPFDLLKSGINWIFDKIFGVKRDENGKVTTEGWASWASTKMSEFSFEETIGNLVAAPFKVIEAAYLFVKDLFTNPKEAFKNLWTNLTGIAPGLFKFGEYIFDNLVMPAWNWITGIFKEDPSQESKGFSVASLFDGPIEFVKNMADSVTNKLDGILTAVSTLFSNISHIFSGMGDVIATQVEFEIKAVINGFKNAFDRVATFIRNLGDNLYIMMSEALQFNFPGVTLQQPAGLTGKALDKLGIDFPVQIMPAFSLGLGNAETRSAAANRVDSRNAKMHNRIRNRNSQTADALAEAEAARASLMEGLQPIIINQDNRSTNTNATTDRRTYVATGGATDGFNLNQPVQP